MLVKSLETKKLRNEALRRGLILTADKDMIGNHMRIDPPATILEEEVYRAVEIIDASLKAVTKA